MKTPIILHEANPASGGNASRIGIESFLQRDPGAPQSIALIEMATALLASTLDKPTGRTAFLEHLRNISEDAVGNALTGSRVALPLTTPTKPWNSSTACSTLLQISAGRTWPPVRRAFPPGSAALIQARPVIQRPISGSRGLHAAHMRRQARHPVAATFARDIRYLPEPLLIERAIVAGCEFLSPIGHRCDTLVSGRSGTGCAAMPGLIFRSR
jgi:hypothetical protein